MRCPTPTKHRFRDRIAAELALATIHRKDRASRVRRERRAYACPCGAWHLTSQKPHPKEKS